MWWMTENRTGLSPLNRMNRLENEMNRFFGGTLDTFPSETNSLLEGAFDTLPDEMNRLFEGNFDTFPAVNIWSNEHKVEVRAEIPGVDPKDLKISVTGNQLSIEAEVKPETDDEKAVWHRQERPYGKFAKSFTLPCEVHSEKAVAKCSNGILRISLHRLESSKPRRIELT